MFSFSNTIVRAFEEAHGNLVCVGVSPTTGRDLFVCQRDEKLRMNWDLVTHIHTAFTKFRLPTPEEQDIIFAKREEIGGFNADEEYPSSESKGRQIIVVKNFGSGENAFRAKCLQLPIRLVCDDYAEPK